MPRLDYEIGIDISFVKEGFGSCITDSGFIGKTVSDCRAVSARKECVFIILNDERARIEADIRVGTVIYVATKRYTKLSVLRSLISNPFA
jgi:hypothetical protein